MPTRELFRTNRVEYERQLEAAFDAAAASDAPAFWSNGKPLFIKTGELLARPETAADKAARHAYKLRLKDPSDPHYAGPRYESRDVQRARVGLPPLEGKEKDLGDVVQPTVPRRRSPPILSRTRKLRFCRVTSATFLRTRQRYAG